jgi:hypothetical protein
MPIINPSRQKIVVEITEGEAQVEDEATPLGMLPTWMPPLRNPRRGGAGIYVYDLGYLKTGETFFDLPYDNATAFTPNAFFGTFASSLNDTEIAAIQAKVLEVPKEEFKDNYKLIEAEGNDALYGLVCRTTEEDGSGVEDVSYSEVFPDERWTTAKGLRLKKSQILDRLEFRNSNYFGFCALSGVSQNHITDVLDPEAPAVDFIPSLSMDVYLFPRGYFWQGAHTNNPSGSAYTEAWYFLSSKRVKWRDPYYNPGSYPPFPDLTGLTFSEVVQVTIEWQLEIAKLMHINITGVNRVGAVSGATPLEPPIWTVGGEEVFDSGISFASNTHSFITGGYLIAIVKKGSSYYYVWGED